MGSDPLSSRYWTDPLDHVYIIAIDPVTWIDRC